MCHRAFVFTCFAGLLAAALTISSDGLRAEDPNSNAPASPAAAAPVQPPLGQTLQALLKQTGYAFKQPNQDDATVFDVYVDYRGEVYSIRVTEQAADWKYPDNSEPRFVTLWAAVTPWYTKENDIPAELTRAVAVANENDSWISYGLYIDPKSKDWVISCEAQAFLKGMNSDVLGDYLQLMANSKANRKGQFAQFVTDQSKSN